MKKKKRIFAGVPSEQAKQTKKEVLSGKCLRTQHNKETGKRSFFKAADGIIAALKKRSALPVHANNPRAAFTLAEVLITLTIIGVVSALTIPTLVQKTNKQEYVSALQKAYSTLSQATQMIIAEEGSPKCADGGWACSVDSVYDNFRKYLSSAKECGSEQGCIPQNGYKHLNKKWSANSNTDTNGGYRRLVFADGTQIMFDGNISRNCSYNKDSWTSGSDNFCAFMLVDINGVKGPNIAGRDAFWFVLKEKGLYPAGCDSAEPVCGSDADIYGFHCTCKVLREGRMDY